MGQSEKVSRVGLTLRNFLANLAGQLLYPILSIALVPFYIRRLGLEGYALVGFFSMLTVLLSVFTKGLGAALQREFARRYGSPQAIPTLRSLLLTFELVYWVIGAVLGLSLIAVSGLISTEWLTLESLSPSTVRQCLLLISLSLGVAFPSSVYQSVFIGTQRQVLGNTLNVVFSLVSAASGVLVVLIWGSVVGFYLSGTVNTGWNLMVQRYWASRILPPPESSLNPSFRWEEVKFLWRISVSFVWTSGTGLVVSQLDRVFISNLLTLTSLGVYNVGSASGRLLSMLYQPFLQAVYPQTCDIARKGRLDSVGSHLVRNGKVVMIICMTFGLPLSFFARDILELWIGDPALAEEAAHVMALYVYGNIFISCAGVLYQVQMAMGCVRGTVVFNTLALCWFPLVLWFLVGRMGLTGAAWAWVLYCGLGWIFNIIATSVVMLNRNSLAPYLRAVAVTGGVGIATIYLTRFCATYYFMECIWGRVFLAGLGASLAGGICYILNFGFYLPPLLSSYRQQVKAHLVGLR